MNTPMEKLVQQYPKIKNGYLVILINHIIRAMMVYNIFVILEDDQMILID